VESIMHEPGTAISLIAGVLPEIDRLRTALEDQLVGAATRESRTAVVAGCRALREIRAALASVEVDARIFANAQRKYRAEGYADGHAEGYGAGVQQGYAQAVADLGIYPPLRLIAVG
jgi:hypothetical protein